MKNTVKKILALVFVVAMVCSLAVPAFAADEEKISVTVTVVDFDGKSENETVSLTLKKANVEEAVSAYNKLHSSHKAEYSSTTGKITKVAGESASQTKGGNVFGTGYWAVALNGKLVSEDMSTVAVENGDRIVVYWNDPTFGTKLVLVDDSAIAQGIVSLYYYDAEGNRQPLKGAKITLKSEELGYRVPDMLNKVNKNKDVTEARYNYEYHFTTDEKGQIWISPEYLDAQDGDTFTVEYPWYNTTPDEGKTAYEKGVAPIIKVLDKVDEDDGYTKKEYEYYNANIHRNIVDVEVIGYEVEVEAGLYDVAGATGDMTIVYVLVAAAAVVTLGAVVITKKKAVKAN